ncbi:MAG: hypothetical protein KJN99_12875, partial [Marinicaulis sp.]|nr:hypothetical protein [Marinicaulis sp.]
GETILGKLPISGILSSAYVLSITPGRTEEGISPSILVGGSWALAEVECMPVAHTAKHTA